MNGRVKVKDMTPVFDVRHICTYLLLTRVYVQERYFWLVRCSGTGTSPANNRLNAGCASKMQAILNCHFSSKESVNKWFPFQNGKCNRYSVYQQLLDLYSSHESKAKCVAEWRGFSTLQQCAKRKELGVDYVIEPCIVPVTKPAEAKQPSQIVCYQNL
jgi:hypothetical protein